MGTCRRKPDGFGVRYIRGDIAAVEVGDVVALRPRESSHVQICLVKRVSNAGQARLKSGCRIYRPHALVIDLPGRNGGAQGGILLPRMPILGNAAGLLSQPGSVPDGLEVRYPPVVFHGRAATGTAPGRQRPARFPPPDAGLIR